MKNVGLISSLAIASLITLFACTLEPTADPSLPARDTPTAANLEASSTVPDEAAVAEPLGSMSSDAVVNQLSGCGRLNFCDKPNDSIGTDCTNLGCSFAAAKADCMSILANLGCSLHCDPVMRDSGGHITYRGFSCGGRCCPLGTEYCGPQGACCDGVHFNSQCPPL